MQLPKWTWAATGVVLLLLFNLVMSKGGFFHLTVKDGHLYGSLIDILKNSSIVMLLALGMTLVIATRGVDLSVGAVMAIAGAIAATMVIAGMPFSTVLPIVLAICLVLGFWNGLLVAVFDVQPMVATLILMVSGRGIAQLITKGQIPNFDTPSYQYLGRGYLFMLPFGVWLVVGMLLLLGILTRKTALGLFVETVGDNETAARFTGINVRMVKMVAYILTGLCAGLAGLVYAGNIGCADSNNAGLYKELDAILAVVIGGTSMNGGRFSLVGSLLGALMIQTLETTILALNVPPTWNLVVKAIAVLIVCLLQSESFRKVFISRRATA
jgi:simple sugar transport system permease protein